MTEGKFELWELIGPTYRLPLGVEWFDTLGRVDIGAGIPLLKRQREIAVTTLTPISDVTDGKFFIYRPDLMQVASLSEKTEAEEIVRWMPDWKPVAVNAGFDSPDEFVQAYCRSAYAVSRDALMIDALWISLCKFMLHWLVNKKREVKFGFATLIPFTFRKNWKNMVVKFEYSQFRSFKIFQKDFLQEGLASMIQRGVANHLCGTQVIAWDDQTKNVRDTLEIMAEPAFHEMVARREAQRYNHGKHREFAGSIAQRLRFQLERAMEVYANFLKESKCRSVGINHVMVDDSTGKPEWSKQSFQKNFLIPAVPDGEDCITQPKTDPSGKFKAKWRKAGALPDQMPGVRSTDRPVRDQGPDIQRPDDQKG